MTEKFSGPHTPVNQPRPARIRLLRGVNGPADTPGTATPPHLPQPNDSPAGELENVPWQATFSLFNGSETQTPLSQGTSGAMQDEMLEEISAYTTMKMPSVKAPAPLPSDLKQSSQPVYGNTSYDRRLAKRRRIDEKKLSWNDLRQFGQFVTPFKWQIILAFSLTVAVGLTALPMPYIFHTMLDQVFPRHDAVLLTWSLAILLAVFLLAVLLGYLNRNILGSLSLAANLKIIFSFYRHMLRLPLSFYQGLSSTGQVLSPLNEVTSAQQTDI